MSSKPEQFISRGRGQMNLKYAHFCLLGMVGLCVTVGEVAYAQSEFVQGTQKRARPVKKPSKELLAILAEEARRKAQEQSQAALEAQQTRAAQEGRAAAEADAEARAAAERKAKQEAEIAAREAEIAARQADQDAREKSLQQAEALLQAGKPAEAYALLEPLEFERSGEVRFDHLLGNAALASNQPDKATLAFERVVAVDPDFVGARLDMARAYYQLGDLVRARNDFSEVMKLDPPDSAKTVIQQYLDAIEVQSHASDTRLTGYVEGMVGHDTNINSATSLTRIPMPNGIPDYLPSSDGIKTSANYSGLGVGLEVIHPITEVVSLYVGADARNSAQNKHGNFNWLSLDGRVGALFVLGQQDSLRAGIMRGRYDLASEHYRNSVGLNAEWNHAFSQENQTTVFFQRSNYRFVDKESKSQDFDQSLLGAGWMHVMPDAKSTLYGNVFSGQERDVDPASDVNPNGGRADGRKHFTGMRAGWQGAWTEQTDLFVSAGVITGAYGKYNTVALENRRDKQYDLTLGSNWHGDKHWSVRPQLVWMRNDSNILLYGYSRVNASLTIRRDFN